LALLKRNKEAKKEPLKEAGGGWLSRLKSGLSKTSSKLGDGLTSLVSSQKKLDEETLEGVEELLISADIGVEVSSRIVEQIRAKRYEKPLEPDEIKREIASQIEAILKPYAHPVDVAPKGGPFVILVMGVNGNGKTTTVGKMANLLKSGGWNVLIAACDTFRAAAVEQLIQWGERAEVPVYASALDKADPSSVAYQAYEEAVKGGFDILLIDTAGRMHNKSNLMAELEKMLRVIKKHDENAPHSSILVLDATTGQNAHSQVETFKEMANVTGLIVTKLDGTAKGGVVVALAEKFRLPIHAVGVGEGVEDLREFEARDFAESLVGL
jgi:fused signal recognition particle receptor